MENEQKEEIIKKQRQIIIETDGDSLKIVKDETVGKLELLSILSLLLNTIQNQK